jgi:sugar lactone lactonase YvrE
MKVKAAATIFLTLLVVAFGWSSIQAAAAPQFPQDVTFTTLQNAGNSSNSLLLPFPIEGLTGDDDGNLYTTGRAFAHSSNAATNPNPPDPSPCPVWRINITPGTLLASFTQIGTIPNPTNSSNPAAASCGPSGITFDAAGNLYVADSQLGGVVWRLTRNSNGTYNSPASISDAFAKNVPGTNGFAFDRDGNLWTGDGTTGQGRVWKITGAGADCTLHSEVNCVEVFRIQPMANEVNLVSGVGGVGRDIRALPPGTITVTPVSRNAQNTLGSQPLVANGLQFDNTGNLFVIDTARGALWKVEFDRRGNLQSPTGCDETFTENTLCLSNVFVAHPIIEGGDGFVFDVAGNFWVDANERNAVAVVTKDGRVGEIFRNPINTTTKLRNEGDTAEDNKHILEFPTSPFISGTRFCTSQSDGNRRDNSPNTAGEINSSRAFGSPDGGARAKISCMTDPDTGNLIRLNIPGMPLPVH